MKLGKFKHIFFRLFKIGLYIQGVFFTIFILLSFTTIPFWMYYHLGVSAEKLKVEPDYIVVMGGGGMPSETGLIRTYFASEASINYPNAKVIIALPGDIEDTLSAAVLMKKDIVLRGVKSDRISFESIGTNTRSQALEIKKLLDVKDNILIITSPEHMYRSVKAFVKVGLVNTGGEPAFEKAIESNLLFNDEELGGNNAMPEIGGSMQIRYQFWNHMKYQIIVYREYFAITYYKLKSWI